MRALSTRNVRELPRFAVGVSVNRHLSAAAEIEARAFQAGSAGQLVLQRQDVSRELSGRRCRRGDGHAQAEDDELRVAVEERVLLDLSHASRRLDRLWRYFHSQALLRR
jgi:hypothetical protein